MDYSTDFETRAETIADLFKQTFTASEGVEERNVVAERPQWLPKRTMLWRVRFSGETQSRAPSRAISGRSLRL